MRYAGELVEAGAVPSEIYAALYEQDSLARLQLRGRILARTQDRTRRPARTHRRAERGLRSDRRAADRHRGRDQPDARHRRHRSGRDPGRATHRRIQDQLSQPHAQGRLQRDWPSSSAAAGTKRRPARSPTRRWPRPKRRCLTLCARPCDNSAAAGGIVHRAATESYPKIVLPNSLPSRSSIARSVPPPHASMTERLGLDSYREARTQSMEVRVRWPNHSKPAADARPTTRRSVAASSPRSPPS